jgi:hypothetical protein
MTFLSLYAYEHSLCETLYAKKTTMTSDPGHEQTSSNSLYAEPQ